MDQPLRPEPLHSAPTCCGQMRARKLLLSWEMPFGVISVVNFLCFAFRASEHLSRCTPLWGSEVPLWLCLWVGRKLGKCVESFLPSQLPPWGAGLCPELLCLPFFVFTFCPTWFWGDWFVFLEVWGPLPVFRCYVGIVPHADDFLIYLWGRRWSPCPIPSPSCRSSWA